MKILRFLFLSLLGIGAFAQQASSPAAKTASSPAEAKSAEVKTAPAQTERVQADRAKASPDYVLGPGDQIVVRALNAEEIPDKPVLIDMGGYIRLPLAGRVHVGGLTVAQ